MNKLSTSSRLLVAKDLRKSYGPRQALAGLSFSLKAGHVLGFLGPNGAGKTTAIRILTTIMEPDSGYFVVDGISSKNPDKIRRKIGVLSENLGFPKNIMGLEYLTYFGRLYGLTTTQARTHGLALLEDVGLSQRGKSLVGSYSHGMRQRLGIARALINDPVVVFLDEPTLGLDPQGQKDLLDLVRRIARERSAGVILCSHLLSEIEVVCDDVLILKLGEVVETGSVAEVTGRARPRQSGITQGKSVRIQVPAPMIAQAQQVLSAVGNVKTVTRTGENAGWLQVEFINTVKGNKAVNVYLNNIVLNALIRAEIPILSFEAENRLEDVFLNLTKEVTK